MMGIFITKLVSMAQLHLCITMDDHYPNVWAENDYMIVVFYNHE